MRRIIRILTLFFATMLAGQGHAYKIKVDLTIPKGSAGEKLEKYQPVSTKFSPCSATKQDAIEVKITYDAKGAPVAGAIVVDRDVFVIFHNPDNVPRFLIVKKPGIMLGVEPMTGFASMSEMDTLTNRDLLSYLPRETNAIGVGVETLFGGPVSVDRVFSGLWQVIAIVADRSSPTFSFDDPTTWDAWDVATIMFGSPWNNSRRLNCD